MLCNALGLANWIDVCPLDGALLASGGLGKYVKIFDRREAKIVRRFDCKTTGKTTVNLVF